MKLVVEELPLTKIKLPKQWLKEHPDHQIRQIANSIKEFGFNDPIAIDESGHVIEGVGRVLAAKHLKMKKVPAIRLGHLSPAQKRAYRIAHNKITLNSGFNLEALREEFEVLSQLDESLLTMTGFEEAELNDLLNFSELPSLLPELTESLKDTNTVACPKCGEVIHV